MIPWRPALLALALLATIPCGAQPATIDAASSAPPAATHDCGDLRGTALATCRTLNERDVLPAGMVAGPNDCSGLAGEPLAACHRLNAAAAASPRSAAGRRDDCADLIGDALRACRVLNGEDGGESGPPR